MAERGGQAPAVGAPGHNAAGKRVQRGRQRGRGIAVVMKRYPGDPRFHYYQLGCQFPGVGGQPGFLVDDGGEVQADVHPTIFSKTALTPLTI